MPSDKTLNLNPLVSVVVPVFNGERYLRESLDSILRQTYRPMEVLVMDDASTDSTADILASYRDRVKIHRQPRNRGQFGNVNDGIAMAKGDFIAVYHSDDIYHPEIVEREAAFLRKHPEAAAVFCLEVFMDADGKDRGRVEIPSGVPCDTPVTYPVIIDSLLKYKNHILCGPSSMVRASAYLEAGPYRDEFNIVADLEMWLRIAERHPLGIIGEYLMRYRYGHGNVTQKYHSLRTETEQYFQVVDHYLARGGKTLASPEADAAYEAHRAEDRLMISVNHYILGQREESRSVLGQVQAKQILATDKVQYIRLLVLLITMKVLVRLPRIPLIARLFHDRWHVKKYSRAFRQESGKAKQAALAFSLK
jgi:glycosyltransferase involved in cell wall biosynthesis